MKQTKFGELIFSESDVCDMLMQGIDAKSLQGMIVDSSVDTEKWPLELQNSVDFAREKFHDCEVSEFHARQQQNWHMPPEYKNLDIATHVLNLCNNQAELQRCGEELLLFQERNLFDLLRYLVYLVDVMQSNKVIWGVGRGSSVASYVLFKLKVHRIDSLYYNLNIEEFLR
jgi:DNA polymerase III alpha subunit